MKITVAPDSFKGSLSATHAAKIIKKAIKNSLSSAQVTLKPMADGGEGTLDTLIDVLGGKKINIVCKGPLGNNINIYYGIINEETAIIEIAKICGLTLIRTGERNPEKTTSYGVGEVIKDIIDRGITKIIIGLGGSATNDGGYGMLTALGVKGFDENDRELSYFGSDLYKLNRLDWSRFDTRVENITIAVANDVNNPLCGQNGASYIYGKQKGGTKEQIKKLDEALFNYSNEVKRYTKRNLQNNEGSGAAGGLGFALSSIGAKLTPGAKLIGNKINLNSSIASADLVITGEGKSDYQTLNGKAPIYVSHLAKKYTKPIILISGSVQNDHQALTKAFTSVFSITNEPMTLDDAMNQVEKLLYNQVTQIMRLIKLNIK